MPIPVEELERMREEENKKIEEKIGKLNKRFCYKCKKELFFNEYRRNMSGGFDAAVRIWNAESIELYCCSCYSGKKDEIKWEIKKLVNDNSCSYHGSCPIKNLTFPPVSENNSTNELLQQYMTLHATSPRIEDRPRTDALLPLMLLMTQQHTQTGDSELKKYCEEYCYYYNKHNIKIPDLYKNQKQ